MPAAPPLPLALPALPSQVKWGADFLINSHPEPFVFVGTLGARHMRRAPHCPARVVERCPSGLTTAPRMLAHHHRHRIIYLPPIHFPPIHSPPPPPPPSPPHPHPTHPQATSLRTSTCFAPVELYEQYIAKRPVGCVAAAGPRRLGGCAAMTAAVHRVGLPPRHHTCLLPIPATSRFLQLLHQD